MLLSVLANSLALHSTSRPNLIRVGDSDKRDDDDDKDMIAHASVIVARQPVRVWSCMWQRLYQGRMGVAAMLKHLHVAADESQRMCLCSSMYAVSSAEVSVDKGVRHESWYD